MFGRVEIILYLCIEIRIAQLVRAHDDNREAVGASPTSDFHNRRFSSVGQSVECFGTLEVAGSSPAIGETSRNREVVSRLAHNQKNARSSRASATKYKDSSHLSNRNIMGMVSS